MDKYTERLLPLDPIDISNIHIDDSVSRLSHEQVVEWVHSGDIDCISQRTSDFLLASDTWIILRKETEANYIVSVLVNVDNAYTYAAIASKLYEGCRQDTNNWSTLATIEFTNFLIDKAINPPMTPQRLTEDEIYIPAGNVPLKRTSSSFDLSVISGEYSLQMAASFLLYLNSTELKSVDDRIFKLLTGAVPSSTRERSRCFATKQVLRVPSLRCDLMQSTQLRNFVCEALQSGDTETEYHAAWMLWLCTFEESLLAENGIFYNHRSILRVWITEIVQKSITEKIVRLNAQIILNLSNADWLLEILLEHKVDYRYGLLQYEVWRDKDVYNLLHEVAAMFKSAEIRSTSYDRYLAEIKSGHLNEGAMHTERYWTANVGFFELNEFEIVKLLVELLDSCDDFLTLSLALFDLGEFARLYPKSRMVLMRVNAQERVMSLLESEHKPVAREALRTAQKMMLNRWMDVTEEGTDITRPIIGQHSTVVE